MSAPPCRVLYLNHGAKPSGAEFALYRMLGAIDRQRVEPVIVFGEEGPAADLMREIGVQTEIVPLTGKVREVRKDTLSPGAFMHLGRLVSFAGYAAKIARVARQQRAQIIHTNTIKAHLYGALAGRLAGLPVVWHVRDYVNEPYFPRAAVQVVRALARYAPKRIIGVSRGVVEQLHLAPTDTRATVILDGLTDRELAAAINDRPAMTRGTAARIGMVGRVASWKGQHVFIEAAAQVLAAGYDAEFIVIGTALFGEEEYEAGLHRQAERLGLGERVKFLGFKKDVVGELRQLDVLVHASTTAEPFGQVIVEGMAVGLPVVASRGGGALEIITPGENGLLSVMGDPAGLAAALRSLLEDPANAKRLGRNGYEHVRQNFQARQGARRVVDVYESILGDGRR